MPRITRFFFFAFLVTLAFAADPSTDRKNEKKPVRTALERHLEAARALRPFDAAASPGSAFSGTGRYADLSRDFRAANAGDILTIVVSDRASATSRGTTTSKRESKAKAGIEALGGAIKASSPLAQLAGLTGSQDLQGQGETSRNSNLTTTLSARVTEVLPNGDLVVEGAKEVLINSERQLVEIRGVARWNDVSPFNQIRSDRLAQLEVRVNGRGVVGDVIRRPNFLYRLLMSVLPF